jgi:hypothetical protein
METEKLFKRVAQILESLDIPYLVTGGIAVAAWGRIRATYDIDIVIKLKERKIPLLMEALRKLSEFGYIDGEMAKEALKGKTEFNFIDPETGLKVDFWIKKEDEFSKNEFKGRILKEIGDQKIYFISPEDLILRKLEWYKLGELARDLEDIESILKISKVDLNYIKKWAKKQSTILILEKILKKQV